MSNCFRIYSLGPQVEKLAFTGAIHDLENSHFGATEREAGQC